MQMKTDQRLAMVTGASGNLGQAVVAELRARGDTVVALGSDQARLEALYDDAQIVPVACDLRDAAAVERLAAMLRQRYDRIDSLINLVGGFAMGSPVHATAAETWERMYVLNNQTMIHALQAVVPHMLEAGRGQIVNIGAAAAAHGVPAMGAYIAAKAAVERLTQTLSEELKSQGIQVNCVAPGVIDTPQNRAAMPAADASRWVSPQALARVIAFLTSPASAAIHGACIPVRGLS